MRLSRILIAFLGCVTASASLATAQRPASMAGGRIAGIAPAPAPPADFRRPPVFFRNVPVVVLADGSVYAELGHGFERVVHPCGVAPLTFDVEPTPSLIQPGVLQPSVSQPPAGASDPLPAVSSQLPAQSPQILPPTPWQMQAARSDVVNTVMCWANDGAGKFFVGRP